MDGREGGGVKAVLRDCLEKFKNKRILLLGISPWALHFFFMILRF
jgi:hypothetical protein